MDGSEGGDANNNLAKYSLRPRATKEAEEVPSRAPRRKKRSLKSRPLSKHRRKTANARERSRMREINQAFEELRRVIPRIASVDESTGEKMTKISTLRLAMKYISALDLILQEPEVESDGDSILSPPDMQCPQDLLATSDFALVDLPTHTLTASLFTDSLPVLQPLGGATLGNSSYSYDDVEFLDFS